MDENEKIDHVLDRLYYNTQAEILKVQVDAFDECPRVALDIDSALWRANNQSYGFQSDHRPSPMMIGNAQKARHKKISKSQREQRQKNMDSGVCVVCLRLECSLFECRPGTNNVQIEKDVAIEVELSNYGESGKK